VGAVLKRSGGVRRRCQGCNLRFERSDENYFSGAMFFGLLMGEFTFALILLVTIVSMWPNVPWDTMTWAIPAGMFLVMALIIPVSRVVWLSVDVFLRPVQAIELHE
jgi:hypothetical protein